MTSGISKAIITAAGKGSRMKHMTSIMPKILLPLFSSEESKRVTVPIADLIMKSLSAAGVSRFCFVVGKNKSILTDYMFGRDGTTFVFQNDPKGFGDAVLKGKEFAGGDAAFVHADDGVLTGGYREAASLFIEKKADCVLLLRKTDNPRRYGIAEVGRQEEHMGYMVYEVKGVEEKPEKPKSEYMLSAVYLFKPKIFESIGKVNANGEVELTDGIQKMIEGGSKVYGMLLEKEKWLNVGDTDSYYTALRYSYEHLSKQL